MSQGKTLFMDNESWQNYPGMQIQLIYLILHSIVGLDE